MREVGSLSRKFDYTHGQVTGDDWRMDFWRWEKRAVGQSLIWKPYKLTIHVHTLSTTPILARQLDKVYVYLHNLELSNSHFMRCEMLDALILGNEVGPHQ